MLGHHLPKRRSIRLKGHDYASVNVYFLTICAYQKECIFGEVRDHDVLLNEAGMIVKKAWLDTERIRSNVFLGEYVIMPNHFHGIIWVTGRGTARRAPTTHERFGKPVSGSLPTIVRSFKSAATKRINELRNASGSTVWQRGYYEHIIRELSELERIQEYITSNHAHWAEDEENPFSPTRKIDRQELRHGE